MIHSALAEDPARDPSNLATNDKHEKQPISDHVHRPVMEVVSARSLISLTKGISAIASSQHMLLLLPVDLLPQADAAQERR